LLTQPIIGRGLSQVPTSNGSTNADGKTSITSDILLQDPVGDDREDYGFEYYEVVVEPPILLKVDLDMGKSITVQVGRLRKELALCQYQLYVSTDKNGAQESRHNIIVNFQDGTLRLVKGQSNPAYQNAGAILAEGTAVDIHHKFKGGFYSRW
jgi:hypothetical protein